MCSRPEYGAAIATRNLSATCANAAGLPRAALAALATMVALVASVGLAQGPTAPKRSPEAPPPNATASQGARPRAKWACEDGMEALLGRFAQLRRMRAEFHEEKTIALLAAPLHSQGSVYFVSPALLLREQRQPTAAAMLLDGDTLRIRDEAGERTARLSSWGAAEGLVSGYLDLLRGSASGLERHYHSRFSCQGDQWRLELKPKTEALKKLLERMVLTGEDTHLTHSDMVDAHGDRTVTHFSNYTEAPENVGDAAAVRARFARVAAGQAR